MPPRPTRPFHFKQFSIYQDKCAMKVGTDGVLLGAWADCEKAEHILDVGTGSGLIALMLAQRNLTASITAIEIEKNAFEQAQDNVSLSNWSERIFVLHQSLQEYSKKGNIFYDLIISNPPYFHQSYKAADIARNQARHTDTLNANDLLKGVDSLLHPQGTFSLILPVENLPSFQQKALDFNLHLTRITTVKGTPNKAAKRHLLSFQRKAVKAILSNTLIIETGKRHDYTTTYKALTHAFYLDK